jgi:deoxynucleotide monophosphate kinase-like protein
MIVGLAGYKRSGKDTAAHGLVMHGWKKESFAAPIRTAACALLGISLAELDMTKESPRLELGGKSLRQFMQLMGTEFGREMIDPAMWLQCLITRIVDEEKVVISDVRFPNEAGFVLNAGGIIIRIHRDSFAESAHASELPLPNELVTYEVLNDSTPGALQGQIRELTWRKYGRDSA